MAASRSAWLFLACHAEAAFPYLNDKHNRGCKPPCICASTTHTHTRTDAWPEGRRANVGPKLSSQAGDHHAGDRRGARISFARTPPIRTYRTSESIFKKRSRNFFVDDRTPVSTSPKIINNDFWTGAMKTPKSAEIKLFEKFQKEAMKSPARVRIPRPASSPDPTVRCRQRYLPSAAAVLLWLCV